MGSYRLVEHATADLTEIVDYYSDKRPEFSDQLIANLTRQFELLVISPKKGRARDELLAGMRSVYVEPYQVFYRIAGEVIEILRVIHGSRDIMSEWFLPFAE